MNEYTFCMKKAFQPNTTPEVSRVKVTLEASSKADAKRLIGVVMHSSWQTTGIYTKEQSNEHDR